MDSTVQLGHKLEELYFGDRGLFHGIDVCRSSGCIHSGLILIYTLIDVSAFLDLPPNNRHSSGTAFVSWSNRYLQPQASLGVSSDDLWIARCGIIHGLMGGLDKASKKSTEGRAEIHYAYGSHPIIPTEILSRLDPPMPRVMLHLDVFIRELRLAVARFLDDVIADAAKTANVADRLEKVFANLST